MDKFGLSRSLLGATFSSRRLHPKRPLLGESSLQPECPSSSREPIGFSILGASETDHRSRANPYFVSVQSCCTPLTGSPVFSSITSFVHLQFGRLIVREIGTYQLNTVWVNTLNNVTVCSCDREYIFQEASSTFLNLTGLGVRMSESVRLRCRRPARLCKAIASRTNS